MYSIGLSILMNIAICMVCIFPLKISTNSVPHNSHIVEGSNIRRTKNPFTSKTGLGTMHGDTASSDTTPYSGPGSGPINFERINLLSTCPTLVQANDGFILALCVTIFTRSPIVYLFSPTDGTTLASLNLVKGGLFGGVYAYVDEINNLVVGDGNNNIHRIAHSQLSGTWQLNITGSISVQSAVSEEDYIVGLSPDWYGNIWFGTSNGVIGYANFDSGIVQSLKLPHDESIANSISTIKEGTFVATDYALYCITISAESSDIPTITWRYAYERGPGRKPGQLSWGTGSTPTIFGPANGTEYVTITDNAVPINLLIIETLTGKLICKQPIFKTSQSGSENSPIGWENSVYIASTYGYPYPALPPNAGTSLPSSGKFIGGLTRVDINATTLTCNTVWTNEKFRSAAVPKLSIPDNLIYTINRVNELSDSATTWLDSYYFATVAADTGNVVSKRFAGIGWMYDSLQQAALITKEGHYFQGVISGVNHIWKINKK